MSEAAASITDLVALYDELALDGQAPTISDYCAGYPGFPKLPDRLRALVELRDDLSRLLQDDSPPPSDEAPQISGFTALRPLGVGGMGRVWLAEQESPRRTCALKLIDLSVPAARDRFRREADLAARLSHPRIATVFAFGVEDEQPYLAAEYVRGFSLRALLRAADVISPTSANAWIAEAVFRVSQGDGGAGASTTQAPVKAMVELAVGVADALAHAHARGVIHRDVKPSNIIVGLDGGAKLIDFGIAVGAEQDDDRLTRTGTFIGSHGYAAPEQLRGEHQRIGPWTDTYALGATLFEMLTQRTPFETVTYADRLAHVDRAPPAGPRAYNRKVSRALDALVMKALSPEPDARFHDGEEMAEALRRCPVQPSFLPRIPAKLLRYAVPHTVGGAIALVAVLSSVALTWNLMESHRQLHRARAGYEAERMLAGQGMLDLALAAEKANLEICLLSDPAPLNRALPSARLVADLTVSGGRISRVRVGQSTFNLGPGAKDCMVKVLEDIFLPGIGLVEPVQIAVDVGVLAQ